MKKEIEILVVADSPALVVRIKRVLHRAGLSVHARRVETSDAFCHELDCHRPDVVLANHGPPAFDDRAAQALASAKRPDIPFIFVTDSVPETMTSGAACVGNGSEALKSPLTKLATTLRRAVREARKQARMHDLELRALTARWSVRWP